MVKLNELTIKEALKGLTAREFSAKELTEAHIKCMENTKKLNAFIYENKEKALIQADLADKNIKEGKARLLEGIPVAVKDLFCTKDMPTSAGSKMLYNFIPPYESTVTDKLFSNGVINLGKTNMDEFAMGSSNMTSNFGNVINPWRNSENPSEDLVPGGSSGGSAASVAAFSSMMALGSDTGGSIRQPASFCGIVGVKPTYGRCSRYGMIAFASSLDQAGIFTRSVYDAALTLSAICGYDKKDPTSSRETVPNFIEATCKDIKGLKIGIPKEYYLDNLPDEIKNIWNKGAEILKSKGAEIIEISLPNTKYGLAVYYIIAPAEASSNLARYDGIRYGYRTNQDVKNLDELYELTRMEGFGSEVKRRILIGTYVLSSSHYDSYYRKAQSVRTLIRRDFDNAFDKVDAIIAPSSPNSAFSINQKFDDPILMYLNDVFTIPASLAGLPCMNIPAGLDSKKLPLGLQIITKSFNELGMFKVASSLEEGLAFNERPNL